MSAGGDAQEALFKAITEGVAQAERDHANNVNNRASVLKSLALAFRYVDGGQQPGSAAKAD